MKRMEGDDMDQTVGCTAVLDTEGVATDVVFGCRR
jgi:hypothetical protein